MKVNANPRPPQHFLAMGKPPSKILIDFDGGRQKSPGRREILERETRERAWGERVTVHFHPR
jgi:hypothetical protein